MKMSFGKAVGIAAQVRAGQRIIEAYVEKKDILLAKKAMTFARHKLPKGGYIEVIEVVPKVTA